MKTILIRILIPVISLSFTTDNGKLSGSVICHDSYESSNKADAGSELYIISEADLKATQYKDLGMVIDNFQSNKAQYSIFIYNTIDPVRVKQAQDNFDTVSKFTGKYISGFKKMPGITRVVTNGTGNYSLNLKPGKYYILVISGNIKSNNTAESKGNLDL